MFSGGTELQKKESLIMDLQGAVQSAESRKLQNADIKTQVNELDMFAVSYVIYVYWTKLYDFPHTSNIPWTCFQN